MNKILVPVDLSETSLNALDTAVEIAKKNNAEIIILNVTERNIKFLHDTNSQEYLNKVSEDVLYALTGALEHTKEITTKLIQTDGQVVECIISKSLSEECDLIVMGSHGASGYRNGYVGSTTYNVIKYSECPVLAIPPQKKYESFKKVLFPIRPTSGALVRYDFVSHFLSAGSTLQVLGLPYQLPQTETNILNKLVDEIRYQLHEDEVRVNTFWEKADSVANDILRFADTNLSDLLVITTTLDSIAKPDFIGPHTQKLINLSKIPVLVINKNTVSLKQRYTYSEIIANVKL